MKPKADTDTFVLTQTSKNVSIPVANDGVLEGHETVNLTFSSLTSAALGAPNPAPRS
jgi:hypothetical protein